MPEVTNTETPTQLRKHQLAAGVPDGNTLSQVTNTNTPTAAVLQPDNKVSFDSFSNDIIVVCTCRLFLCQIVLYCPPITLLSERNKC